MWGVVLHLSSQKCSLFMLKALTDLLGKQGSLFCQQPPGEGTLTHWTQSCMPFQAVVEFRQLWKYLLRTQARMTVEPLSYDVCRWRQKISLFLTATKNWGFFKMSRIPYTRFWPPDFGWALPSASLRGWTPPLALGSHLKKKSNPWLDCNYLPSVSVGKWMYVWNKKGLVVTLQKVVMELKLRELCVAHCKAPLPLWGPGAICPSCSEPGTVVSV